MNFIKLACLSFLSLTLVANAQEPSGPKTGVLCFYAIYTGAKLDSEVCGWADTPAGKAVHAGVADMEAFIETNSSRPVAEYRSNYAAGLSTMLALSEEKREAYCAGQDPGRPNYFGALRLEDPKKLNEEVRELLARPGEPDYGLCF